MLRLTLAAASLHAAPTPAPLVAATTIPSPARPPEPAGPTARPTPDVAQEVAYWRREFHHRPYGRGGRFEEFAPAYVYAASMYPTVPGVAFEEVDAYLELGWPSARRGSPLAWRAARPAAQDAWERIRDGEASVARGTALLGELMALLHESRLGLEQSAERAETPRTGAILRCLTAARQAQIDELEPWAPRSAPGGSRRLLRGGWRPAGLVMVSGDRALLTACELGETSTAEAVARAADCRDLPRPARDRLLAQLGEVRDALGIISARRTEISALSA